MADSRTPSSSPARARTRKTVRKAVVEAPPAVVAPVKNGVELATIDRDAMVATAAYFRAVNRQFQPGHELEDWLSAEREIDTLLTQPTEAPQ